jgi:hypothetical protein
MTKGKKPAYEPTSGSLADRVIEYFKENPEEELTRDDIAAKFDADQRFVAAQLAKAVVARVLVRDANYSGEDVWKPGPRGPFRAWPFGKAAGEGAKRRKPVELDFVALQESIEDGVPLFERQTLIKGLLELLSKVKKGQHFKLPIAARGVMTAARSAYKEKHPNVVFEIRQMTRQQIGVWRTQ